MVGWQAKTASIKFCIPCGTASQKAPLPAELSRTAFAIDLIWFDLMYLFIQVCRKAKVSLSSYASVKITEHDEKKDINTKNYWK